MWVRYWPCFALVLVFLFPFCTALRSAQNGNPKQPPSLTVACCTADSGKPAKNSQNSEQPYLVDMKSFPVIKLEICISAQGLCEKPDYPLHVGKNYTVRAIAIPRQSVSITLVSDSEKKRSEGNSLTFTAEKGILVFEADTSEKAAGVRLTVEIGDQQDASALRCQNFEPSIEPLHLDALTIINLVGSLKPFTLVPKGDNAIAFYSTGALRKGEHAILDRIEREVVLRRGTTPEELGIKSAPKPLVVELAIPHSAAIGDLASKINALDYSQFKAENAGLDKVRIKADPTFSCEDWTSFLTDVRQLAWHMHPQPFSKELFYLNAGDVSKALNATSTNSIADNAPAHPSEKPASATSAETTKNATTSGSKTADVGQPSGPPASEQSLSTPDPSTASKVSIEAAAKSLAHPPSPSMAPLNSDFLVFGDAFAGDDEAIAEKRRIIAALDLPRPEMIISAWVLQNSSNNSEMAGYFNDIVHATVSENNEALQAGILCAWNYLKGEMNSTAKSKDERQGNAYFDDGFYSYIVGRHVANLPLRNSGHAIRPSAERFLENGSTISVPPGIRENFGFCASNQYCLGYADLFRPLAPRLTDMLLAIIAANNPQRQAGEAATKMEHPFGSPKYNPSAIAIVFRKDIRKKLNLGDKTSFALDTCESNDVKQLVEEASPQRSSGIKLNCFRAAAIALLDDNPHSLGLAQPTPIGLLRAAIADFLYNFKTSQQYPHEFSSYELGRSADVLNSALRPIIDAFNRDVRTFQRFLGAELEVQVGEFNKNHRNLFNNKTSFLNNGLVTVRTISGQDSSVKTNSQTFLDASTAPQLADLAKSILGQGSGSPNAGTSGTGSKANVGTGALSAVLGALTPVQAQMILGALSAYQSSKVQIGRDLSLDVSPHSLNGAVSAEITVQLNASESAPPTYWRGAQKDNSADLSRVATHNTSTRIRVDSIKLFDVSAFAAVIQRSRSRFPLVPPMVEIPYIGTALGIPLPPATEFHSSTALLSAIVVPTAADIASVAVFRPDAVVDPGIGGSCTKWPLAADGATADSSTFCSLRPAISISDLDGQPIPEFHRAMIHCLATGAAGWKRNGEPLATCEHLTFSSVLHIVH